MTPARRPRVLVGLPGALLCLACGGLTTGLAPPPPEVVPEAPAPVVTVEEPELEKGPPAPPWERAPGWPALAARPTDPGLSWTPLVAGAAAAVFDPGAWERVAPGVEVPAWGVEGPVALAYDGIRSVTVGCGKEQVPVAVFRGPELPEGVLWLGGSWDGGAVHRPRLSRPATAARRLYALGAGAEIDLQRLGPAAGVTLFEQGGARPFRGDWQVPTSGSEGASPAVDLRSDVVPGALYPELYLVAGASVPAGDGEPAPGGSTRPPGPTRQDPPRRPLRAPSDGRGTAGERGDVLVLRSMGAAMELIVVGVRGRSSEVVGRVGIPWRPCPDPAAP